MNIKQLFYKLKPLTQTVCFATRLLHPHFSKEIEKRRRLDLFDYVNTGCPLPKCFNELCTDNENFGIGFSIRKYASYNKPYINAWIEHGYFWADEVSELAAMSFANSIFTFGQHRVDVNHAKISQKTVYAIGPYIHYADDYLDYDDFSALKDRLGRTLLVYPVHSGEGLRVTFDFEELIKIVESVSDNYDTILFSLFWSDIIPEYVQLIKKHNFMIVCSGHRFDHYFLSRQKTIIRLSDAVISNGNGTNLVYCTYLGKPFWWVDQNVNEIAINKVGEKHVSFIERTHGTSSIEGVFHKAFSQYSESLTDEQVSLCHKYFGFDSIKSNEEMYELLKNVENKNR